MACLTIEVFRYSSLFLTVMIIINFIGHLVYMAITEKHSMDKPTLSRYMVIAYWLASVGCGLVNEVTKSLYFLSLALLFVIQALVLSVGSFHVIGYLLVTYAVCLAVVKVTLELVILRYKSADLNVDELGPISVVNNAANLHAAKYVAVMHALKKNKDNRVEVILLRLVAYLFTIAFFTYANFRFWKDIFEIPDHAFKPVQLIFPITLLIVLVLLLHMIDLIIYRKDHHLIYLILIFGVCLVSFFLTHHIYNFAFLLVYLIIISVIYICKLCYSAK